MDKLKEYLNGINQTGLIVAGVFAVALIGCVSVFSFQKNYVEPSESLKEEFASVSKHANLKSYFTEQMNGKIAKQEQALKEARFEMNESAKAQVQALKSLTEEMQAEIKKLKSAQEESGKRLSAQPMPTPINAVNNLNFPPAKDLGQVNLSQNFPGGLGNQKASGLATLSDEIEITEVSLEDSNETDDFVFKDVQTYVPAGTYVRGVLIGGIDAHTEVYGRDEPRMVTIRLNEEGYVPNSHRAKLKNCVVLASAWGNISSERVTMRPEVLTCTNKAGKVLETRVVGMTYGPDGRQDVKGRVVYPEGKLVQRAFMAGTLSGIGNGIANSFTTNSISPLGATSSVNGGDILQFGAASGASKGLDKLSDYYIKRAEQLQPVIQVGAGVEVDVVFQEGFFLDGRKHEIYKAETQRPEDLYGERFEQPANKYEADAKAQAQMVLNKLSGGA